ncbi:MAG: hypothetical protein R2786_07410 [Flavobacteriaceae bacterium]
MSPENRDELCVFRREGMTGGEESLGLDLFGSFSGDGKKNRKNTFLIFWLSLHSQPSHK